MKLLLVTDIKLIVNATVIIEIPRTSYSCTGFRHQVDRGRKRVPQEMLLLQEMFGSVRKGKTQTGLQACEFIKMLKTTICH